MFLSLDGTSIIQLLNFAIFFAILNVVFLRPVGAAIRKRREYIDSVKNDYDRYTHEIAALRSAADAARAAARREAEEIVSRERSDAEREAAAIVGAKTREAETLADAARATVAGELTSAREREPELAGALAANLLERALGNAR
jgi:F0F1-type ATP synthase membrane subunit b/b'